MAYDIQKTYTNLWAGISDDEDIWPENSAKDIEWIDIYSNERYAKCAHRYINTSPIAYNYANFPFWYIHRTDNWYFRWNISGWVNYSWTTLSGFSSIYQITSSGDTVYVFDSTWIHICSSTWVILTTITSGYPSWWALRTLWWYQHLIIFAQWSQVYTFDTTTNTITAWPKIRTWTIVKYICSYSYDSIVVVGTNRNNTLFYEFEFNWSSISLVAESEFMYECIDATHNGYSVFWISPEWLHEYQARQSQLIKSISLNPDMSINSGNTWTIPQARISYDKWPIICNNTDLYIFKKEKPWRNYSLTRHNVWYPINNVEWWVLLIDLTSEDETCLGIATSVIFKRTNSIILRPLDWWFFNIPKHDLNYRIGYSLPAFSDYDNDTTYKCEVVVSVKTHEMDRNWIDFVEVWRINTDSSGYFDITPNNVRDALETAWYDSKFSNVETKIELLAWDKYDWLPAQEWYYKTPELYDITISANYVEKP